MRNVLDKTQSRQHCWKSPSDKRLVWLDHCNSDDAQLFAFNEILSAKSSKQKTILESLCITEVRSPSKVQLIRGNTIALLAQSAGVDDACVHPAPAQPVDYKRAVSKWGLANANKYDRRYIALACYNRAGQNKRVLELFANDAEQAEFLSKHFRARDYMIGTAANSAARLAQETSFPVAEQFTIFKSLLPVVETKKPRANLLTNLGVLAMTLELAGDAIEYFDKAMSLFEEASDRKAAIRPSYNKALLGDGAELRKVLVDQIIPVAKRHSQLDVLAAACFMVARCEFNDGKSEISAWLDKAAKYAFLTGNRRILFTAMLGDFSRKFRTGGLVNTIERLGNYEDFFERFAQPPEALMFHSCAAAMYVHSDQKSTVGILIVRCERLDRQRCLIRMVMRLVSRAC